MKLLNKTLLVLFCFSLLSGVSVVAAEEWILVEGGSWVPDSTSLSEMQLNLEEYVKNISTSQGRPIKSLKNYIFQYRGEIENGYKLIVINAMCEKPKNWPMQKEMVFVCDGGNCYFTLKYEIQKRVYYNLFINGEA